MSKKFQTDSAAFPIKATKDNKEHQQTGIQNTTVSKRPERNAAAAKADCRLKLLRLASEALAFVLTFTRVSASFGITFVAKVSANNDDDNMIQRLNNVAFLLFVNIPWICLDVKTKLSLPMISDHLMHGLKHLSAHGDFSN